MQLSVVRPVERRRGELAACALLGFGAALAAGFLFGEVFGTGGHRRMGRLLRHRLSREPRSPDPVPAVQLARVRGVLAADPVLHGESIEVRRRGGGLELRGWLSTRSARALAHRLARSAAGDLDISNHLLVRGEDDLGRTGGQADSRTEPPLRPTESPRSA